MTFAQQHPLESLTWHHTSQYLVIVSVPNEATLTALADRATERGISHTMFREPDYANQVTAVAFEPGARARRLCANLPLAGKPATQSPPPLNTVVPVSR